MSLPKVSRSSLLWAVALSSLVLLPFQNMIMVPPVGITYSQFNSLHAGVCTIRPSVAGAPIYNAIVSQRAKSGLRDVEVLHHVSTRLGFGLSPHGSLVPNKTNDCTTVFIAEELARQISMVGSLADSPQVGWIRRGLMPFSMFSRADVNKLITRFENDPLNSQYMSQFYGTAAAGVFYKARQEVALLATSRNIFGSQVVTAAGTLEDHQFNLHERIGEFWVNHFNVDNSKAERTSIGSDNLSDTIHTATGTTFNNLLAKVIRHPAMLRYLDNNFNIYTCNSAGVCASSNQNLARELLELHTFGAGPKVTLTATNSPYGQADVVALSEVLAGWNHRSIYDAVSPASFVFHSTLFAKKTISLMNVKYPANTAAEAEARVLTVLKMLANHPATKQNICKKLAGNLFAPTLVPTALNACVAKWGTDGNLKEMYKAMLYLPHFWSLANYRTLYRTPIEIPIAAARGLGMNIVDMYREVVTHYKLSNAPYNPATLTIPNYATLLTNLKKTPVWWRFYGVGVEIRRLLGVYRGEVALPIGYSDNGLDHLSSAFIDESSRMALIMSNYLEGQADGHLRLDKVSYSVRTQLEGLLLSHGTLQTQQHYIQNVLNMGAIVRYRGWNQNVSPYELPLSQQHIISIATADRTKWPYPATAPGAYFIDKLLASLAHGNAIQLKK